MTLLYSVLICLFAQIDAEYLFLKTVEKEKNIVLEAQNCLQYMFFTNTKTLIMMKM